MFKSLYTYVTYVYIYIYIIHITCWWYSRGLVKELVSSKCAYLSACTHRQNTWTILDKPVTPKNTGEIHISWLLQHPSNLR